MKRTTAFTVLELLLAFGIVIVLTAILLPVFRRGMDSAQEVKCISNLRQLSGGWTALQADGGSARFRTKSTTSDYWGWVAALEPYFTVQGIGSIILCPAAKTTAGHSTGDITGTARTAWQHRGFPGSYGFNACLYSNMSDYGWPSSRMIRPKSAAEIYPIIADSSWFDMGPSDFRLPADYQVGNRWIVARHQGRGVNIAFSDGSVRFKSIGELVSEIKLSPEDTVPRVGLYQLVPGRYR